MFIKKIPEKLHRILFPNFVNKLEDLDHEYHIRLDERDEALSKLQRIGKDHSREMEKQPTLADLMRDNLGLTRLNFTRVEADGVPKHFLDIEDKDKRQQYINELHQIFQFEVFHVMCQNHIDTQGNFSFRTADSYDQMLAGRFSVNGISLIKNDVKKGHDEYMENSKPREEFDPNETTEGVISINKE